MCTISIKNISKTFNESSPEIFKNVNLNASTGEKIAIVGASGIGKTTLLNIIGGLERPSTGSVRLASTNLNYKPDDMAELRKKNVGIIFQFYNLFEEFTAIENVSIPLLLNGYTQTDAKALSREALAKVGLSDRETYSPSQLSGGQKQRVAIARAISNKPSIILADEPTGNLDAKTASEVTETLLKVQEENKICLISVTHSEKFASLMDKTYELKADGLNLR